MATRAWELEEPEYKRILAAGVSEGQFVEMVALANQVIEVDTMDLVLGRPVRPLPRAAAPPEHQDPVIFAGQYHYVYLDKGRNDGVRRGNRFKIQRRGDGGWLGQEPEEDVMPNFPWENYGQVMVVESFEETSLGIVASSIRELVKGDRLVMEKGY